jgi:hypothetical protein
VSPNTTRPDEQVPGAPFRFYPTLDEFVEYAMSLAPNADGEFVGLTTYEAFLLALLWRWNLEDDPDSPDEELEEVSAQLAVLNAEIGDAGRLEAMRQLVAWINDGDGWLSQRVQDEFHSTVVVGHKYH